jgi:transcriptional regulator GlxA family with amidase domain
MANHRSIANKTEAPSPHHGKACRELVEEAQTLALAEVDEPLHISGLCVALAVSERTLRKAFHKAYGLPPCRHLRMLRLSRARWALMSADSKRATVTEIATSFGFVELGRFSVEYRKAFGETLHHAFQAAP